MTNKSLLKTLRADELRKRLAWKCPLKGHRNHNALEHPRCYEKLHGIDLEEKVLYLDIEAEDLRADYGITICWCAYDTKQKKMFHDCITIKDIKKYSSQDRNIPPKDDTRIIKSLIDLLNNYDRVITHFGCVFDIRFIRTRAIICGLKFPSYGALYQSDSWIIAKRKLKLSRNTLQNLTLKTIGKTRKDHLSHSIKHGCLRGEKWALKASLEHCKKDVLDLRDVFPVIENFMRKTKTSI